jgi:hypothetical protein
MKKFILVLVTLGLSLPLLAGNNRSAENSPVMGSEMMESEESYTDEDIQGDVDPAEERMEERRQNSSTVIESDDEIDYQDRTRTNRERKALNTSGDASDDE